MAIRVESITASLSTAERCAIHVLDLERKVEWKGFKSKFRLSTSPNPFAPNEFPDLVPTTTYRFKSFKFLLTNSKVPRDTKKLVAGVGEKKANVRVNSELPGGPVAN